MADSRRWRLLVENVLRQQLDRLKQFAETGKPTTTAVNRGFGWPIFAATNVRGSRHLVASSVQSLDES